MPVEYQKYLLQKVINLRTSKNQYPSNVYHKVEDQNVSKVF